MDAPPASPPRAYTSTQPRKGATYPWATRNPEGYQKMLGAMRERYATDEVYREEKRARNRETSRRYYQRLKADMEAMRARLAELEGPPSEPR